jgi:hypothetical protein
MPLEITLALFNSLIVYYTISLKQAVSCNNNTTLPEVCVEISPPISINNPFLKLLSNKPLYKLIYLLTLLYSLYTALEAKLKPKLYKSVLPNIKTLLLKNSKHVLIL